jgi:isoprenylcysteine carboxyl methyltransferase (ICMT) family protein YpbQ
MSVLWIALAVVALQRIATLAYSHSNTRRMLAEGGVEAGMLQFPLIALLQLAWLASMAFFIAPATPPAWGTLIATALVEMFHTWAIVSLGRFWSTRVVVVPGTTLVHSGPYRIFRHPNYIAVFLEILLLPAAFHAYAIGIVFAVAYAALIAWRVRDEDRLLTRLAQRA